MKDRPKDRTRSIEIDGIDPVSIGTFAYDLHSICNCTLAFVSFTGNSSAIHLHNICIIADAIADAKLQMHPFADRQNGKGSTFANFNLTLPDKNDDKPCECDVLSFASPCVAFPAVECFLAI